MILCSKKHRDFAHCFQVAGDASLVAHFVEVSVDQKKERVNYLEDIITRYIQMSPVEITWYITSRIQLSLWTSRKYHNLVVIFVEGSVDPKPATFWGSGHGRYPQLQRHAGDGGDWTGDDRGWLNGLNGSSDQKCGQDQQPEVYYPLVNI